MTSVKFNRKPFEGSFSNIVDDLFAELPVIFKNDFNSVGRRDFTPVNVKETDNSFLIEVIAPGFDKPDFKINLDQKVLTISAEKKSEQKQETEKNIRREYNFNSFKRSFTIDEKVDATKIEATYINGVLTLNLPKKEAVKEAATEITIK